MLRPTLLFVLPAVLSACGDVNESDPNPASRRDGEARRVGIGGSPADWSGPPVSLSLRPPSSRMPGTATIEIEVPSSGFRLRREDSRRDGDMVRFDLELEAPANDGPPADADAPANGPQTVRIEEPIPAGVVRVEAWVRRTTRGIETVGFARHELASTAVRSIR